MLSKSISVKEFNEKIQSGEARVLTLAEAKKLTGKRIAWSYNHDSNNQCVYESVIGSIQSEWDYYKTQPMEGFDNRTEYWRTFMRISEINHERNRMILLNDENKETFMFCQMDDKLYDEPTFCCSDGDREVYFVVL